MRHNTVQDNQPMFMVYSEITTPSCHLITFVSFHGSVSVHKENMQASLL